MFNGYALESLIVLFFLFFFLTIDENFVVVKFWYLFLITSRVLALAMFASTFRSWFWIILVAHWFGMLFWILRFVNLILFIFVNERFFCFSVPFSVLVIKQSIIHEKQSSKNVIILFVHIYLYFVIW